MPAAEFVAPWPAAAAGACALGYAGLSAAAWRGRRSGAVSAAWLAVWLLHGLAFVALAAHSGVAGAWRFGFASALSLTVWQVVGIYGLESRLLPLHGARLPLALLGVLALVLALVFPGDVVAAHAPMAPLHWLLGLAAYGLFGVAVLHALLLDASEQRLRRRGGAPAAQPPFGLPLLTLERLTLRFVEGGFVVLTLALVLGFAAGDWQWSDRKTVLSLLSWAVFAGLLAGRHAAGWRGRQATRWIYAGALLLLLAYAGSRFVLEVVLGRTVG